MCADLKSNEASSFVIFFFKFSIEEMCSNKVFSGFGVAFGHVFQEPATINYPFEKGPLSSRFRYFYSQK